MPRTATAKPATKSRKKTTKVNAHVLDHEPSVEVRATGLTKRLIGIQKQIVEFQRATFDGSFDAIIAFQDQQEQMVNDLLERVSFVPEEGKQLVNEWIETYKKGREDFRTTVEKSYDLVENYLDRIEDDTAVEAVEEAEKELAAAEEDLVETIK